MELIWKELPGERIIYTGVSQGTVEGGIPLPEGRSAKEILSYTGEVAISSSSAREGEIAIEGVVRIDLICMDDKVFAFTSSAPFTHRIAADGVREGMRAEVRSALQSLEINKGEGGITLNAVADINAMVTASGGAKVLDGISGIEDREQQRQEMTLYERAGESRGSFRLREEIEAPFATEVLYSEVHGALRDVSPGKDGICLEGTLYISALVQSRTGAMSQLSQAIPFTQTVDGEALTPMWGEVRVSGCQVRGAEDFGVVIADVELTYRTWGRAGGRSDAVTDTFSPTVPFECTHGLIRTSSYCGLSTQRQSISENIMIPDGMPEAARVVYATARPMVTSYGIENGVLTAEGLLFTRILYTAESGCIFAFNEDIPFSVNMEAQGATDAMIYGVAAASAAGGGRSVELNCTLILIADLYCTGGFEAVTGIEECPQRPPHQGITVYFASAGDTLYSIAREYNTSRANLLRMNDLPEVLQGGERVAFMR